MSQIQQYLKMESQEEKAFLIMQKQKEIENKEILNKKMKEFEKLKNDKKYSNYGSSTSRY
jgi:hypothetical protein